MGQIYLAKATKKSQEKLFAVKVIPFHELDEIDGYRLPLVLFQITRPNYFRTKNLFPTR